MENLHFAINTVQEICKGNLSELIQSANHVRLSGTLNSRLCTTEIEALTPLSSRTKYPSVQTLIQQLEGKLIKWIDK